jgi:hypothetical protein
MGVQAFAVNSLNGQPVSSVFTGKSHKAELGGKNPISFSGYCLTFCTVMAAKTRVARWYIFKPKFPNLEGLNGMENAGVFYARLKYITAIWYLLWSFGNVVVIW